MTKLERMKTLLDETKTLESQIPSMTEPDAIRAYTEIVGKAEVLLLEMTEMKEATTPMELQLFMMHDQEQLALMAKVHSLILTQFPESLKTIGLPLEIDDIFVNTK